MCVSFLTLIIGISFYPLWSISKECLCCKKGFLTNFPLNLLAFEIPNYLRIFNDLPRSGYGYFLKLHIVLWKVVLKKTFVGDWHFENPILEVTFRVKQKAFSQSMVLYVLKSLVTETDCSGFFFLWWAIKSRVQAKFSNNYCSVVVIFNPSMLDKFVLILPEIKAGSSTGFVDVVNNPFVYHYTLHSWCTSFPESNTESNLHC